MKTKPKSTGLAALLDDDEPQLPEGRTLKTVRLNEVLKMPVEQGAAVVSAIMKQSKIPMAKIKGGNKLAALMDDDDAMPPTQAAEPVKATPAKPQRPAVPAPVLKEPFKLAAAYVVHCGDRPVLIVIGLDAEWKDLLCYDYEARATRHLLRQDLTPKSAVDEMIDSMRAHFTVTPTKKK